MHIVKMVYVFPLLLSKLMRTKTYWHICSSHGLSTAAFPGHAVMPLGVALLECQYQFLATSNIYIYSLMFLSKTPSQLRNSIHDWNSCRWTVLRITSSKGIIFNHFHIPENAAWTTWMEILKVYVNHLDSFGHKQNIRVFLIITVVHYQAKVYIVQVDSFVWSLGMWRASPFQDTVTNCVTAVRSLAPTTRSSSWVNCGGAFWRLKFIRKGNIGVQHIVSEKYANIYIYISRNNFWNSRKKTYIIAILLSLDRFWTKNLTHPVKS